MNGKLDTYQNKSHCGCGEKGHHGIYIENDLIYEFCDKCYAEYLLSYMSCVHYVKGFMDAKNGTKEQAAELAAKFSGVDSRIALEIAGKYE